MSKLRLMLLQVQFNNFNFADLTIKYISLIVLVVQNASQVLIMRYVRTRPREMFLSTVAVFVTEVVKLVFCFFLVCIEEKGIWKFV